MADKNDEYLCNGKLLDLSFLTAKEKEKIEQVLREDEKLRTEDKIRLGTMRQKIEQKRYHQKEYDNRVKQCSICEVLLKGKVSVCPNCGHSVCQQCKRPLKKKSDFVCTVCYESSLLEFQSDHYYNTSQCYGSELVRRSMDEFPENGTSNNVVSSTTYKVASHDLDSISERESSQSLGKQSPQPSPTEMDSSDHKTIAKKSSSSLGEEGTTVTGVVMEKPLPARKLIESELSDSDEEEDKKSSGHFGSISSFPSTTSLYSCAGGTKGHYEISGEVLVGVELVKGKTLVISVNRARGLAAADKNGLSDPYIKTYLLPDKSKKSKRKTKVKKKTLDPVYQESLTYSITQSDISSGTIWLSVWDHDRFGRNSFLGETHIPLTSLDLSDSTQHWYTLQDQSHSDSNNVRKGSLIIGLKLAPYQTTSCDLHVRIKSAELACVVPPEAFVTCCLLPDQKKTKRKTQVCHSSRPVWENKFILQDIPLDQLSKERALEVSVWDSDESSSHTFLGGFRLGPLLRNNRGRKEWMDCVGEEVAQWEAMLSRPGQWVESTQILRPNMDPRDIDFHLEAESLLTVALPPSITEVVEEETQETHNVENEDSSLQDTTTHNDGTCIPVEEPLSADQQNNDDTACEEPLKENKEVMLLKTDSVFGLPEHYKGDYEISGEVLVGVELVKGKTLVISVNRARGLAAADKNGLSDPYVKTYLLPHKDSKKKTSVKKKTLEPVYNEQLKYSVTESDISFGTIWLSAWDHDKLGKNSFLGETHIPLASLDLSDSTQHWYTLSDKTHQSPTKDNQSSHLTSNEPLSVSEPFFERSVDHPSILSDASPSDVVEVEEKSTNDTNNVIESHVAHVQSLDKDNEIILNDTVSNENTETKPISEVLVSFKNEPDQLGAIGYGSTLSLHKGDYEISGEVLVGVELVKGKTLVISVNRARGLAAADKNGLSDPYVKTYLLPHKDSKKKTSVKKKTLEPVYNEQLKYSVTQSDINSGKIWLSVWDHDKLGRNSFLGETHIPLASLDLSDSTQHWYTLSDKTHQSPTKDNQSSHLTSNEPLSVSEPYFERSVDHPSNLSDASPSDVVEVKEKSTNDTNNVIESHVAHIQSLDKDNEIILNDTVSNENTETKAISEMHVSFKNEHEYQLGTIGYGSTLSLHKGDYEISGEVLVGVELVKGKTLVISVNRARGLAAADKNGLSDPYVKTYLLPIKNSKKKTSVKKKTLEPVYNEQLKYSVTQSDISSGTIWLSVWDHDKLGKNSFLGETYIPLTSLDLSDSTQHWYTLNDKAHESPTKDHLFSMESPLTSNKPLAVTEPVSSYSEKSVAIISEQESSAVVISSSCESNSKQVESTEDIIQTPQSPTKDHQSSIELPLTSNEPSAVTEPVSSYSEKSVDHLVIASEQESSAEAISSSCESNAGQVESIGHLKESVDDSINDSVSSSNEQLEVIREVITDRNEETVILLDHNDEPNKNTPETFDDDHETTVPHVENLLPVPTNLEGALGYGSTLSLHKGDYEISGEVLVGVELVKGKTLVISVNRARGLAAADKNGLSDPYVKTYLLPHKDSKKKTSVKKKTLEPVYNEQLKYSVTQSDISSGIIWLSVWDNDRLGRNSFLGETHIPLTSLDLSDSTQHWYTLHEKDSSYSFPAHPPITAETDHFNTSVPPIKVSPRIQYSPKLSSSISSISSISGAYGSIQQFKGDYEISGEVLVGVELVKGKTLVISVNRARGLAAVDKNGLSNPYIKTYLLPNVSQKWKRKTEVRRKTLDPIYNENLKYSVTQSDISSGKIWLSVWDHDRLGKNRFLGETHIPLASLNLSDSTQHWYTLQDRQEQHDSTATDTAEVDIGLCIHKGRKSTNLKVFVKQAKGLPVKDKSSPINPYIKCYLLPDKKSSSKRKTKILHGTSDPVWEEELLFENITIQELMTQRVLEVTVWDFSKNHTNELIGGFRLGPSPSSDRPNWMDSIGDEISHWDRMCNNPDQWITMWHSLRDNMEPRDILF